MKNLKLLILLTFFLFQNKLIAQPNPFFPMENGVWEEGYYSWGTGPFTGYRVTFGDTLINGEVHAKIYSLTVDSMGVVTDKIYLGATKTNAETVDYVKKGASDSYLLYDFSLETGESIELMTSLGFINTLTVTSNSLMTDAAGVSRRVIAFDTALPYTEIWVEGIGSNRGLLTRGLPGVIDYDPYMNCFKYEDILLWTNETTMPSCEFSFTEMSFPVSIQEDLIKDRVDFQISPNPMEVETTIQFEGLGLLDFPELRIYNLQGQLIQKIVELNEEKFSFFRKDLNAGMYVFELFDTKTTFALRKKLIIH